LIRGRGNGYVREASPLFDSPLVLLSLKGEGEEFWKRGFAPLKRPINIFRAGTPLKLPVSTFGGFVSL